MNSRTAEWTSSICILLGYAGIAVILLNIVFVTPLQIVVLFASAACFIAGLIITVLWVDEDESEKFDFIGRVFGDD